jgi:hypothetical protein
MNSLNPEYLIFPAPYFGGKSAIIDEVWPRFGAVANYVEPFVGSGAMLLGRPGWNPDVRWLETINDASGLVANFWRAVHADPEAVAHHADAPVNENDQHAKHIWLVHQKDQLVPRLEAAPDYYDAKVAGRWIWLLSCWIGSAPCSGEGPWRIATDAEGYHVLVNSNESDLAAAAEEEKLGIQRQRPRLGDRGRGVHRGKGIKRQLPDLGGAGRGVHNGKGATGLYAWMKTLCARLRYVRVCCGDWARVISPVVTSDRGTTAIFLDPPYSGEAGRDNGLYEQESLTVAHDVRHWCAENGDNPLLRIALCGYIQEHEELEGCGWRPFFWSAHGGYGNVGNGRGRENRHREVIWFSPHCVHPRVPIQRGLFE